MKLFKVGYKMGANEFKTTEEGFLLNYQEWRLEFAGSIARIHNITLTDAHWEVISTMQKFYQEFERLPSMRIWINYLRRELSPEKGNSTYLHQLFPNQPIHTICKMAGLPKPPHCM